MVCLQLVGWLLLVEGGEEIELKASVCVWMELSMSGGAWMCRVGEMRQCEKRIRERGCQAGAGTPCASASLSPVSSSLSRSFFHSSRCVAPSVMNKISHQH